MSAKRCVAESSKRWSEHVAAVTMFKLFTGLTRTQVVATKRAAPADRSTQHFESISNGNRICVVFSLENGERRYCRIAPYTKHPQASTMGEFEVREITL